MDAVGLGEEYAVGYLSRIDMWQCTNDGEDNDQW